MFHSHVEPQAKLYSLFTYIYIYIYIYISDKDNKGQQKTQKRLV
jgi:hypothetical protein